MSVGGNPWDREVYSGLGWTDHMISQWGGRAVSVVRNFEVDKEYMRVLFPDGSVLYLGVDGAPVVARANPANDVDVAGITQETDAYEVFLPWLRSLYDSATAAEVDTDLSGKRIVMDPGELFGDAGP